MGTLLGHIVPGTFFCLFGLWYIISVITKYVKCRRLNRPYRNSASFPCICCPGVPVEGILKIGCVAFGVLGEAYTGFDNGHFAHLENAQHITMFAFFSVNGFMDILYHYRFDLPPDLDYVTAILALVMEGLLFYFHLHGRTPMDVQVHTLLFYTIIACAVATVAECRYKSQLLPALCRAFFTLLQGIWFFFIGFILYSPSGVTWNQEDHRQMMVVTMMFAWSNGAAFTIMMITGALIWVCVRRRYSDVVSYTKVNEEADISHSSSAAAARENKRQSMSRLLDESEDEL